MCLSNRALKITQSIGVYAKEIEEQFQGNKFVLDWVLIGSGNNSVIKYSNESYLEGRRKEKLKLQLVRKQWSLILAQKMGFRVFCGLHRDRVFICV